MATTENALNTAPPQKAATVAAPPAKDAPVPASTPPTAPAAPRVVARKGAAGAVPGKKVLAGNASPAPVKKPAPPVVKADAKTTATAAVKPKAAKPAREKKAKLVRDSFTIPKDEYGALGELKHRAGSLALPIKKSELLRAGIKALTAMSDRAFLAALKAVPTIKTGRPAKD